MINLEEFASLEEAGVYISFSADHYKDGSNLCFSIDFPNGDDRRNRVGTGWYNDNHEFGGAKTTVEAAIKLAKWYLEKPGRIKLINSGYHDLDYIEYKTELHEFTKTLIVNK